MRLLWTLVALTGCYNPSFENCAVTCNGGECPSGYECVGNVCRSSSSGSCMGGGGDGGGIDADLAAWKYRKAVGIASSSDTMSVVVPIRISRDVDIAAHSQSTGADIRFVTTSNDPLPHELEHYDNGTVVAWVKVPALTASSGTVIYMLFGNPSASAQETPSAVWDSDYLGVYHLADLHDSTGTHNGTGVGGTQTTPGGLFGSGQTFFGTPNDSFTIGTTDLDIGQLTFEAWVDLQMTQGGMHRLYTTPAAFGNRVAIQYTDEGPTAAPDTLAASTNTNELIYSEAGLVPPGSWHQIAVVLQNGSITFFIDGLMRGENASGTFPFPTADGEVTIGGLAMGNFPGPLGDLDEVRVSKTARTAAYFATAFELGRPSSTSIVLGPLEML